MESLSLPLVTNRRGGINLEKLVYLVSNHSDYWSPRLGKGIKSRSETVFKSILPVGLDLLKSEGGYRYLM